jgi:hypothetical protein
VSTGTVAITALGTVFLFGVAALGEWLTRDGDAESLGHASGVRFRN